MRYLWKMQQELSRARAAMAPPLPGDTVQSMFWNGVGLRADQTWLRSKKRGVWQSWT